MYLCSNAADKRIIQGSNSHSFFVYGTFKYSLNIEIPGFADTKFDIAKTFEFSVQV